MGDISSDEETQLVERDFFYLSPSKRLKVTTDRLSALPDSILIHILSFLGVEESAVTGILSKRWRFLWTQLPKLEFNEFTERRERIRNLSEFGDMTEKTHEFVDKVDRTLLMRGSMTRLDKFEINFRYSDIFALDVDSWLDFALENKATEVILLLNSQDHCFYDLPQRMCSNSSLTRFLLQRIIFYDTLTKFDWKALIQLDINFSSLPQHVLENILSGCPVLRTLGLGMCWEFNSVVVKSRFLHELKVHYFCAGVNEPVLEISAPFVQTLDISFSPEKTKLVLRNVNSLVSAKVNFDEFCDISEETVMSTIKNLFETIKDVKELEVGPECFRILAESEESGWQESGWQLPLSKRTSLTVVTLCGHEHNISGIFALLKSSPNLERLDIQGFEPTRENWDDADDAGHLDFDLLNLKTVEIREFQEPQFGGEPMLSLARNLLQRATVLEKMTIRLNSQFILSSYMKTSQALLSFPRSSGRAVVRLDLSS